MVCELGMIPHAEMRHGLYKTDGFRPDRCVFVKGIKIRANVCVIYSIKNVLSTESQLRDLL